MFINSRIPDFILIGIAMAVAAAFIAGLFFEHQSLQRNTTLAMTTFLLLITALKARQLQRKVYELQAENDKLKTGAKK